jgi:UPF0716 family protein affecting phage T7 exclusion
MTMATALQMVPITARSLQTSIKSTLMGMVLVMHAVQQLLRNGLGKRFAHLRSRAQIVDRRRNGDGREDDFRHKDADGWQKQHGHKIRGAVK